MAGKCKRFPIHFLKYGSFGCLTLHKLLDQIAVGAHKTTETIDRKTNLTETYFVVCTAEDSLQKHLLITAENYLIGIVKK